MGVIVCECGHGIKAHNNNGCEWWIGHKDKRGKLPCQCTLSASLVEARYWARRMMKERDDLRNESDELLGDLIDSEKECDTLQTEIELIRDANESWKINYDALQAKLDMAMEAMAHSITLLNSYEDQFAVSRTRIYLIEALKKTGRRIA